jgi:hypothetical protein
MAELRKVLCVAFAAALMAGTTVVHAKDVSPQRAAAGTGRSIVSNAPKAKAGNASGQSQDEPEQPVPYIPPAHSLTQALILGSIAAGGVVAAFLAANKQNETSSTSTTTGTQ